MRKQRKQGTVSRPDKDLTMEGVDEPEEVDAVEVGVILGNTPL